LWCSYSSLHRFHCRSTGSLGVKVLRVLDLLWSLLIHHFYCMFDLLPDDSVLTVFLIFQCCCNVATCPCLLLQSWIATRPDEQRDTLTKLFMSYVGEESPVEPGIMFDFIGRNCKEAMKTPKAGRASSCLVLLQSLLDDDDVELSASFGPDAQNDLNGEIERIFLYCICWSIGGLLEADDRTKFDAFLR
jgi:hypothetical protein